MSDRDKVERNRRREERRLHRESMAQSPFLPRPNTPTSPFLRAGNSGADNNQPSAYNTPVNTPPRRVTPPGKTPRSLSYILRDVLEVDPADSILAKALAHYGIQTFVGLLSLTSNETDQLVYPLDILPNEAGEIDGDAEPETRPVPFELKAILKGFIGFVYCRQAVLRTPLNLHNCMELTVDEFEDYRCSAHFNIYNNSPNGQPVIPSPVQDKTSYGRTPAQEFDRSIKIDPISYPTLSKDSGFDQYNRALIAIARSHGMLHVLDPSHEPGTPEQIELYEKQLAFLYNVFTTKLLTTKGKELVRKYQTTFDACSIYSELCEYYRESDKADGDKSELLTFIMTHRLTDDSWFGPHDDYITHWNEQVRLYNELETTAPLIETMLFILLANAVSLQTHLSSIKGTADTLQAGTNGAVGVMNFAAYVKLLHSAAQRYDRLHRPKPSRVKGNRKVYLTDVQDLSDYLAPTFDIDNSVEAADYQAFQAQRPFRPTGPRLPQAQWQKMSDDGRRVWQSLSSDDKTAILAASASASGRPFRANLHELTAPLEVESMGREETLALEPEKETGVDTPHDTLLAHVTKQAHFPAGHLQRVMSDKLATTPARPSSRPPPALKPAASAVTKVKKHILVDDDGNVYKVNKVNIVYSVNKNNRRSRSDGLALVDRGCNGGIRGRDTRRICGTGRFVDVEGIDNHQVTDKEIITSAGYTESQRGPVVVILNQQADMGMGQTILSSAQMEAFGVKVDDRSIKLGGTQSITTRDGFVIPLHIRNGLPYLDLRPPTDREIANPEIPQVVLTSDTTWDPSRLDMDIDIETWKTTIPDYDSDEGERPFDSVGILKSTNVVSVNKSETVVEDLLDKHDRLDANVDLDGLYEMFSRPTTDHDFFEANLADIFEIDPFEVVPPMPPEYEVYEYNTRRKAALFVPVKDVPFDLESGPLIEKDSFRDLIPPKPPPEEPDIAPTKRSVVFDIEEVPVAGPGPTTTSTRTDDDDDQLLGEKVPKARQRSPRSPKHGEPNDDAEPRQNPRRAFEDPPDTAPQAYKNPSSAVKSRERDWERLRKYFAWLPKLVIQKTFDCTTQLARIPMSAHLQRHYKSPFPALNVNRRDEDVATDTVYADTPDIEHGYMAAQFFVGTTSLVSDVYGVKTDAQFLQTLQDNVRKRGAMNKLVSDRAQAEVSNAVKDYLRWLVIDDWQSEPHRQNQNYAERRYQSVKRLANKLLDRTGAPPSLWLLALRYACFVYNYTAVKSLGWKTPISVLTGVTPDISVLLRFAFYEKVLYQTLEPSFPSDSTESLGYMVGIAEHVGHAMTYKILVPETNKIIFRSEIRSAESKNDPNRHLVPSDGEEKAPPTIIKSRSDDVKNAIIYSSDDESNDPDALVNNEDLIGRTFLLAPNLGWGWGWTRQAS